MEPQFPTDNKTILQKIEKIAPASYGKNRNYMDGEVNYMSPYLSGEIVKQITITHDHSKK